MINFNTNPKANEAMTKLQNLANALADCGIETTLSIDPDSDIIALESDMWNCVNGSNVIVCAYAMAVENFEIHSYAEPENDRAEALAQLEDWSE